LKKEFEICNEFALFPLRALEIFSAYELPAMATYASRATLLGMSVIHFGGQSSQSRAPRARKRHMVHIPS
jgi:hypothetical protein